ncbi:acyl-CoA dehydrogenase [Acidovorax sp. 56]|uniref:acyl-CoA dehydrogenase family protein n=1 Tax=Acidovorax sp. 56 TaxID=2035205 RepID=UPI000C16649E|nr:acyl-CoA dehydrogenase family protein [Acidovorax sp. 56]PIF27310.1 acyl-CoA dehydrogenase [Acidovorax sp. 56]
MAHEVLQIPRDRAAVLAGIPALAEAVAQGAAQREAERTLPHALFRRVRQSGLGALRIGQADGGPDGSLEDLIGALATLAAADSNVAHALRIHFNATEALRLAPPSPYRQRQIDRVLQGALFGGAYTERGTERAGLTHTALQRDGADFRLSGRKFYATGTAFSDYANVSVLDDDGNMVTVNLPVDREGIEILDDWDGFGQRLTASGSIVFTNVRVYADEVQARDAATLVGRHTSALRQLHLVTTAAGAVRNVLSDATGYVRDHGRPAMHSPAATAREDHFNQLVIGELAAASHAIDALVLDNARQLDRSAQAIAAQAPQAEALVLQGALATAKTQTVVSRLALGAAERMFEAGGASATASRHNFDRHWRNIRTLFNHNPLLQKTRVLGDYHLNSVTTHLQEGRVF